MRRFVIGLTGKHVFGSEEDYNRFHELMHRYRVAVETHVKTTIIR